MNKFKYIERIISPQQIRKRNQRLTDNVNTYSINTYVSQCRPQPMTITTQHFNDQHELSAVCAL